MIHPYQNYLICRNQYLDDPDAVVNLALSQSFNKAAYYPGYRTENLLNFNDPQVKGFAIDFANQLCVDVFPGIYDYVMSLYFHMNESYDDEILNQGWIHKDTATLAGLIYLTKNEENFESGTSIFLGHGEENQDNKKLRENFNLYGDNPPEYKTTLQDSWKNFKETIKIGNVYNRLIAYDSKMYHRPNKYSTQTGLPRLSLIFFISEFKYNL